MSYSRGNTFQYESIDEDFYSNPQNPDESYILGSKLKSSTKILIYSFLALISLAIVNQIFLPSSSIKTLPFLSSPYSNSVVPCKSQCQNSCMSTQKNGKNFCCEWSNEYTSQLSTCSMTFTKNDLCFCTGTVVNKALDNKNKNIRNNNIN